MIAIQLPLVKFDKCVANFDRIGCLHSKPGEIEFIKIHEAKYPVRRSRTDEIRFTNFTDPFVFSMYAIAVIGFLLLVQVDIDAPRQALKDGSWIDLFIWTIYFCTIGVPYLLAEYLDYAVPLGAGEEIIEPKDNQDSVDHS